jgi:hypothetical protein
MAFIASLVLDANTDMIIQSEGFEADSLTIVTPGAQWMIELEDALGPFAFPLFRYSEARTNSGQNVNIQAINVGASSPTVPQTRIFFQSIGNPTSAATPISGTLAQVYLVVSRLFKDPAR